MTSTISKYTQASGTNKIVAMKNAANIVIWYCTYQYRGSMAWVNKIVTGISSGE